MLLFELCYKLNIIQFNYYISCLIIISLIKILIKILKSDFNFELLLKTYFFESNRTTTTTTRKMK